MGQNLQANASDKRAENTFKDAEAVLAEAVEIQKHLQAQRPGALRADRGGQGVTVLVSAEGPVYHSGACAA
jgi:hypothetical protein